MLTQTELDSALSDAQAAVDTLANDVSSTLEPALNASPTQTSDAAPPIAQPGAPASRPQVAQPTYPSQFSHADNAGSSSAADPPAALAPLSPKLQSVLKLHVPVVVRLAQRPVRLSEILKLTPGNILEFERTVDSDLDLMVNNQRIGSGTAVKVNERFGLRIKSIGDPRSRLAQLTGG